MLDIEKAVMENNNLKKGQSREKFVWGSKLKQTVQKINVKVVKSKLFWNISIAKIFIKCYD